MTRAEKWAQDYRQGRPEEEIVTSIAGLKLICSVESNSNFILQTDGFTLPAVFLCLQAPEARRLHAWLQRNYVEDTA